MTRAAVLAPGYGGTAEQGIVRALARALARFDIATSAITFRTSGKRPSRGYVSELEDLRAAFPELSWHPATDVAADWARNPQGSGGPHE